MEPHPLVDSQNRPSQSGFTLLEMLVVIVIIAVLAALLFPAFGTAWEAALKAQCMQNLRTYYLAITAYSNDHDDYVLPCIAYKAPGDPDSGYKIWQTILIQGNYLPQSKTAGKTVVPDGLRCPANPNGYMPGERSPKGELKFKYGTPNYMYNTDSGTLAKTSPTRDPLPRLKRAAIQLSKKALLCEGGEWVKPYRANYCLTPPRRTQNPAYLNPENPSYLIGDVHNNRSHVLFWDGHIQTFAPGAIPSESLNWREAD